MAARDFILRCKTAVGSFTLTELTCDSTVEQLKSAISKITQIQPETMRFLNGFPRKPVIIKNDGLKLNEVNIWSGDILIVEGQKVPVESLIPPMEGTASSFVNVEASTLPVEGKTSSFSVKTLNPPKEATAISAVPVEASSSLNAATSSSLDYMDWNNEAGIMMRFDVPSDNSCLFASINFILSHGIMEPERSSELRNIIATVVRNNPDKYTTAVLGKPNEEYCSWILDSSNWGGAIELAILSEHFELEIVAIDIVSLIVHRFGENKFYPNRVFLIYDGIHYDPLVLELETFCQTIFPSSNSKLMEMAMELAKEAKSSRQFTDVAHFSIVCNVCKAKLRGDKEVTEHAVATGHADFKEI